MRRNLTQEPSEVEHIEETPKIKVEEKNIELELEHIEETPKIEVEEKDIEHDHQDTKEIKKEF